MKQKIHFHCVIILINKSYKLNIRDSNDSFSTYLIEPVLQAAFQTPSNSENRNLAALSRHCALNVHLCILPRGS